VSTALSIALIGFLEFRRMETTLIAYNQAAAQLRNIQIQWTPLTPAEKQQADNLERLVRDTESVIQSEHAGWVQSIGDAISELYRQAESQKREDNRDPG
jgi:hypothetical protein